MPEEHFLNDYHQSLQAQLVELCTSAGLLQGRLLECPDVDDAFEKLLTGYLNDAIPEITLYPTVALGWAMYLGMAVAHLWDDDWAHHSALPDLYASIRDVRGFDAMDEHVRETLLGFSPDSRSYADCERIVQRCAQAALRRIDRAGIDSLNPLAFRLYVRSVQALFDIGVSVELTRLGYKMEQIPPSC